MNKQLPERPDLGQLKKQAKDLLDDIQSGRPDALARIAGDDIKADDFALHDAQRIIARDYGFASWAKLKLHVETRAIDAAEARLIEASLENEEEVVRTLLAERPALATRSVWVAATLGEASGIRAEAAKEKGGPRGWEPLLYLCFGRCGAGDEERAAIAKTLLAAGADPNAHWIHCDWPESPLPALYGATGVNNSPQLARVLLAAGANPNDGESRYHAAEHHHVASLEVLAEFGCDFSGTDRTWGNTPLYFLLGFTPPAPTVKAGVRWLLEHGANPNVVSQARGAAETALHRAVNHNWDAETVALLLRHGADVNARTAYGRTAYALAVRRGASEVAQLLAENGASTNVAETDVFIGACMRGDVASAKSLMERRPTLLQELSPHERMGALLVAREGRTEALKAIAAVGLEIDVAGPDGERPLHWACWHGWAETVSFLIASGVELSVCDRRFGAPPSGWCAHGSQHCANPKGDYGRVMELLIDAGAFVAPDTQGSPEVMAVLKRHGIGPARR